MKKMNHFHIIYSYLLPTKIKIFLPKNHNKSFESFLLPKEMYGFRKLVDWNRRILAGDVSMNFIHPKKFFQEKLNKYFYIHIFQYI